MHMQLRKLVGLMLAAAIVCSGCSRGKPSGSHALEFYFPGPSSRPEVVYSGTGRQELGCNAAGEGTYDIVFIGQNVPPDVTYIYPDQTYVTARLKGSLVWTGAQSVHAEISIDTQETIHLLFHGVSEVKKTAGEFEWTPSTTTDAEPSLSATVLAGRHELAFDGTVVAFSSQGTTTGQ
jgi:hypothetical protein